MAVLNPLWCIIEGGEITHDWTWHLRSQWFNALKIALLRLILTLLVFLPLVAVVILDLAVVFAAAEAMKNEGLGGLLGVSGVIVLIGAVVVSVALMAIVNFLLTFLEIEVAVAGKGIASAAKSSFALVTSDLLGVFLFNLVWWLLGITVGFVMVLLCCTLCLAPVALVLQPLVITPVEWISKLIFWKELCKSRQ
jgi:hypothetical protein